MPDTNFDINTPLEDSSPVINNDAPKIKPTSSLAFMIKQLGGAKAVSALFGMLLLAGGVGAGIILVTQPQLLQQKAFNTSYTCGPNQYHCDACFGSTTDFCIDNTSSIGCSATRDATCPAVCGDGKCNEKDPAGCPQDCGSATIICGGDQQCTGGVDGGNCHCVDAECSARVCDSALHGACTASNRKWCVNDSPNNTGGAHTCCEPGYVCGGNDIGCVPPQPPPTLPPTGSCVPFWFCRFDGSVGQTTSLYDSGSRLECNSPVNPALNCEQNLAWYLRDTKTGDQLTSQICYTNPTDAANDPFCKKASPTTPPSVYTCDFVQLSDPANLTYTPLTQAQIAAWVPGTKIRYCVGGTATPLSYVNGRFDITANVGSMTSLTTTTEPATDIGNNGFNTFCTFFVVPTTGATTFNTTAFLTLGNGQAVTSTACKNSFTLVVTPPTTPPTLLCNSNCTGQNCAAGLSCILGVCRNPSCSTSTNCICAPPPPTASPTPSPTPTPTASPSPSATPTITAQCVASNIFTPTWTPITASDFYNLPAGGQVYFCAKGTENSWIRSGTIDRARFTINGILRPETTTFKPNSYVDLAGYETFTLCDLYTIPANTYSFTVQGEVHDTILGWQ